MVGKPKRRWHWPRRVMLAIAVPVFTTLLILSLPIILPLVGLAQARADKRKFRLVVRWPCGWCVAPLGSAALARADALFGSYVDKTSLREGTSRRRFIRELHACCPRCAAGHRYDEASNQFVLLDPRAFAAMYGDLSKTAVEPASAAMAWPWLPPRDASHTIALTRDSVCLADDVEAPHNGSVAVPADADVAAIGEALLRSPWLAYVGSNATWTFAAGSATLVFGLRSGMPFVHRIGSESVRADTLAFLHIRKADSTDTAASHLSHLNGIGT